MMSRMKKQNLLFASKVFIVATLAIMIASLANLEFPISAGIVGILSVAGTKRETLRTAIDRLFAFASALVIAYICFTLIGYNTYAFLVFLCGFICLCQTFRWNNAMAMNSVLISHFLTFGEMGIPEIINECLLFLIGVGLGVAINLTLRKNVKSMENLKEETDDMIRNVLSRMGQRIMQPELEDYDGTCFISLRESLREATVLAKTNYNNQWSINDVNDIKYIAMREKQVNLLYVMYKDVSGIKQIYVSSKRLSDFFYQVSDEYSRENTVLKLLGEYHELERYMKSIPLPVKRSEFEDRARLFSIMRNMKEFLELKKEYIEKYEKIEGRECRWRNFYGKRNQPKV